MKVAFGRDILGDFASATSREWLETNGLGGFASSTIIGLNTRRYHALLTAATKPPVGRIVLLSRLEETLVIDEQRFELSANQYPGVIHPRGFEYLEEFRLNPFPVFTYRVGEIVVTKSVFMVQGENTTVVRYDALNASDNCKLELRPLIAFRDFHSTTHENGAINRDVTIENGMASVTPYMGLPTLHLAHNAVDVGLSGDWYRNFEYVEEQKRGLDFREDLFHPLTLTYDLRRNSMAVVTASTEKHDATEAGELERVEIGRRNKIAAAAPVKDEFVEALTLAADQFIVRRGSLKTIIAGYHWFADWGRDTMIALPGLTLVTGRFDVARDILMGFGKHVSQGMLPNVFPDAGETPEYNTLDATLWYFEAIRRYVEYSGDSSIVRQLFPVLTDIIEWHVKGTRYGIKVDPQDGLLNAGEPGVQLTWMDAKVGDWVVTPRTGKAVEIQALWYNTLRTMEEFAFGLGEKIRAESYSHLAAKALTSFHAQFWNEKENCLFDVVTDGVGDPSMRPNQIIATSLNYTMLSPERARAVLAKVEAELLTPYGLRTLPPSDPRYIGLYTGDPRRRDSAYHQGTVWPWLLGPFISGYLRAFGRGEKSLEKVKGWLEPLKSHLSEAGLGTVAEIFCADPPYAPCGCIAQAWSVAEVLRTLVEDVHERKAEAFARRRVRAGSL
jgi:predicted glycogen debranching enzyme